MRLRLFFFVALGLLLIHMTTHASTPLSTCAWIGEDSTPFFTACINKNFDKIKRSAGLDVKSCPNFDKTLDYGYQSCVKKNFRHIGERLKLDLKTCSILGEDVNVFYVSCIQKNFKTIERALP